MVYNISSKENKIVKFAKQLKRKSSRIELGQFIAEGKKIVMEALEYAPDKIHSIIVSESFFKDNQDLAKSLEKVCDKIYVVPQNIFDDISDTDTPQGILAVLNMNLQDFAPDLETHEILVLDGISEPGNMGTVIRTAEALGFDGIYLMKGCTDIYSPKTVRSTMGSIFRMKFRSNCSVQDIDDLKNNGFSIISTTPNGELSLEDFTSPQNIAVVIGNEAHGVCDEILKISDYRVKITMSGMAESLNAGVAAGIVMHWLKSR